MRGGGQGVKTTFSHYKHYNNSKYVGYTDTDIVIKTIYLVYFPPKKIYLKDNAAMAIHSGMSFYESIMKMLLYGLHHTNNEHFNPLFTYR